jgi:hypothetical protein
VKRSLFFVLLFFELNICLCQNVVNINPRSSKRAGVDAGIRYIFSVDRSLMFSTNLNYYITHQIGLEINLAMDQKDGRHFSTGGRFHLNSRNSVTRFTPFIGTLIGVEYGEGFIQVPLGLNYLTKAGFETSLCINELFYINSWRTTFLELRLGWRFNCKN